MAEKSEMENQPDVDAGEEATSGSVEEETIVPTLEEEVDPFPPSEEEGLDTAPPAEAHDEGVSLSSGADTTLEEDLEEAGAGGEAQESEAVSTDSGDSASHSDRSDSGDLSAQLAVGSGSFWFMAASVVVFLISLVLRAV